MGPMGNLLGKPGYLPARPTACQPVPTHNRLPTCAHRCSLQLFPALDLARLLALSSAAGGLLFDASASSSGGSVYGAFAGALRAATAAPSPGTAAALQTALRAAANAFKGAAGRSWASEPQRRDLLLGSFAEAVAAAVGAPGATAAATKALRLSWVTLLFNYCVLAKAPAPGANASAPGDELKLQVPGSRC
jgi:hypothetical protein